MLIKRLNAGIIILLFLCFSSCNRKEKTLSSTSPAFNPEIAAFTSGLISSHSIIRVKLSSDYEGEFSPETPLEKDIFRIEPGIDGKAYFSDPRTIEFRPGTALPSGQTFTARLNLSKLRESKEAGIFSFSFSTIPLNLAIDFTGMRAYSSANLRWNRVEGTIRVSDRVNPSDLETILLASQGKRVLPVSWDHGERNTHFFMIDSVERKETGERVDISWDGQAAGLNSKGSHGIDIPALDEFTLMEHHIVQQPNQHISLLFSDPIRTGQDLEGLIALENNASLKFSVEDNEIRAYPVVRQKGKINLSISPGILNIPGYRYKESNILSLNFEEMKPAVRLIGQGVILPGTEGLIFPFEAVNLKAVDVKVIRIFEDNIAQFLQVNELDGSNELKRAGRLVLKKTIDLVPERPISFNEWNAFSLDLSRLVMPDPGALYRVELSFRRQHSLYSCGDDEGRATMEMKDDEFETIAENELAYWDASYSYYDYDYDYLDYNWNEKDDPCTDSYYNFYDRKVARNILSSNLGMIARAGQDGSMLFVVTELSSTRPLAGVTIDLYNFQQQPIASLTTNQDGIAETLPGQQPFLAIASRGTEKGYLRVDKSSALSLSQFDISGSQMQKGLKAFIYGERGVWRPGDSIYISCILEDKEKTLPSDLPVTFELSDPLGKLRQVQTHKGTDDGFYTFRAATSPNDPTGMWSLRLRVGGADFYRSLRVETVKPNRLKIALDFGSEMIYSQTEKLIGLLRVSWLHGAVARGLRASVNVQFRNQPTEFKDYHDFRFTDLSRSTDPGERVIFDGLLNSDGEAEVRPSFDLRNRAPGMVTAIFTTRAFEKGGDFSINRTMIPYSPYELYCGLRVPAGNRYGMLLTDSAYRFDVVSLTETGKPVPGKNLEIMVYKLNWQWWWHSADENLASYTGNPAQRSVFSSTIRTGQKGEGSFRFKVDYPDWGRFLVVVKDPEGGHSSSAVAYFDWPGWAGRSSRLDPSAASILPFSSDKNSYQVGETARVTIPAPGEGRIFLSIENGTRVVDHFWLEASGEETNFSFTITPAMAPNVYIHVSLLQPYAQTKNDLPIRMYGVIPLLVEDPQSHLQPVISMPDVLAPESKVSVTVTEKSGRAMTYTIAMVDEGLLDLTNFTTPDPWSHFYAREALGVTSFDLYNYVLGAYGGRIDGVFGIGGDLDAEIPLGPQKRVNRFPPVVHFEGPFQLGKGKSVKHILQIPNYVGSLRTMVIAGRDGAYGSTEKATPVRKPLMVLSTLPRVLGPGEELRLPVTVFVMEDKIGKVQVSLEINDLLEAGETLKTVDFDKAGDKDVYFNLKVKEKTGIARVKVMVSGGNERAYHETELEVRSPNPEITRLSYESLEPGAFVELVTELPGMPGANSVLLEAFTVPPFDYGRRLKELLRYPHGCLEQVTSAAFPQLYLDGLMDMNEAMSGLTADNIKAAIEGIGNFRLSSGGFSYWPGATAGNEWATTYAGHFLLEAREKGYDVPAAWIDQWIRYQRQEARQWTGKAYESDWHRRAIYMIQAYRLYSLAFAGKPEVGAMNRLREDGDLPSTAAWQLAAAYVLSGHEETARSMITNLLAGSENYDTPLLYTYGSELRDKAIILETMVLLNEKDRAIPLLRYISAELNSNGWHSTQSLAWAMKAVAKYTRGNNGQGEIRFNYQWDNEPLQHAVTSYPVAIIAREMGNTQRSKLRIENTSKESLYLTIAATGTPLAGEEQASDNNLVMKIEYRLPGGNAANLASLEQGTDLLAVVTIRNPGTLGHYRDMALTQIFPSGWEIQNSRMLEPGETGFDQPDYQDIRDDRVLSYFDLPANKTLRFATRLTASYAGKYYLPAVSCGAMYQNDISAVVPGQWVEVMDSH